MSQLRLTLACWDYDRTRALMDGTVTAEGIELLYLNQPVEETFFRMLRYREYDAAEMSLSSYVASLQKADPPFIAIPAFPSRFFRHSCIFVSAKSGIRRPEDLKGKRVAVPARLRSVAKASVKSRRCPSRSANAADRWASTVAFNS